MQNLATSLGGLEDNQFVGKDCNSGYFELKRELHAHIINRSIENINRLIYISQMPSALQLIDHLEQERIPLVCHGNVYDWGEPTGLEPGF
jgi:hypothetical protein